MPKAPAQYRPAGQQGEKAWASRQNGSHALYNLWIWRKPKGLRQQVIERDILCQECLRHGVTTPATEADHIVPHNGDYDRFIDIDMCQALCKPCHSRKTKREQ